MSNDLESIVKTLSNLTIIELNDLRKKLEESWDVKAAAPMMSAAAGAASSEGESSAQKSDFDVVITGIDVTAKMAIIKIVREITEPDLMKAKGLVDALPGKPLVVKEKLQTKEAEELKKRLADAGATVELK